MSVHTIQHETFVVNTPSEDETFEGAGQYSREHIREWDDLDTLWDFTTFNMASVTSEHISTFVNGMKDLNQYRQGRRTAIVGPKDVAFGMMRMLELMADDVMQFEIRVFRDYDEAYTWLSAPPIDH